MHIYIYTVLYILLHNWIGRHHSAGEHLRALPGHATISRCRFSGFDLGGWIFLWILGPLKGRKKILITRQTVGHYLIFLGKQKCMLVFLLDIQFQFLFSENFGVWMFSFLFGASPKTCVALKSMGFFTTGCISLQGKPPYKTKCAIQLVWKVPSNQPSPSTSYIFPGVFFGAEKRDVQAHLFILFLGRSGTQSVFLQLMLGKL